MTRRLSRTSILAASLAVALALTAGACTSSAVDPRCTIDAPSQRYRAKLAQSFNGSALWQEYLEAVRPSSEGAQPLVAIELEMEREVTQEGSSGDYDAGVVLVDFMISNLEGGSVLYECEERIALDSVIFGSFERDATRAEIQAKAFEYTENKLFPYLARWINIAALRAMRKAGSASFVPTLEALTQDPTTPEDLNVEAQLALKAIRR